MGSLAIACWNRIYEKRFGIKPKWLAGDTAYGSADNLGLLVDEKGIEPHIPVIDKSRRDDGAFCRDDFRYDDARDCYVCPAGADLITTVRLRDGKTLGYLAGVNDCRPSPLKARCCPKTSQRKIHRSIHERARDVARKIAEAEAFEETLRHRKKVEMAFAHLKRILQLRRLRLRGPIGAQDEFTLAAVAQNFRKMASLIPATVIP